MDILGERVVLHLLTLEETQRILRQHPSEGERWAPGYPSTEQVDFLSAYVEELRTARPGTAWQAQLRRRSDGLVIGGAGVTGPPDARGAVVVGFEVDPTVPDDDYGVEIVTALVEVARSMGARGATTSMRIGDERARAFLRVGFAETARAGTVVHFGRRLD